MIVTVVLPESKQDKVKQGLESQKSAGISFEYFTSLSDVFMLIRDRGFYMDKLVIIASILADFNDADRQVAIDNLCDICEMYFTGSTKDKEILMVDGGALFENEYHQFFHPYPQFIYQKQKVHPSQLFGLIAGNFVTEEDTGVDKEVKKPGFFAKVFSRRKSVIDETTQQIETDDIGVQESIDADTVASFSDAPLFSDEISAQNDAEDTSESNDIDLDLDLDFSTSNSEKEPEESEAPETFSDVPLFEDLEPESESELEPEPKPASGQNKKQPKAAQIKKEETKKQVPLTKPKSRTGKTVDKSYVSFFQKRSKTILFTGDRRMGSSTVAACLAEQASRDGLYVLLLDLDYERRGQSVNFPIQYDENDTQRILSLYHAIKNASNIDEYAIQLNDNLDYLGTSLLAESTDFMYDHVDNSSLQLLLSLAMGKYDLIIIDCPFLDLKRYPCLIAMSNYIIHSTLTDCRAVINLINLLTPEDFASSTDFSVYMSKMMFLLNQFKTHFWNNVEINERNLTEYMIDLTSDTMYRALAVIGRIPEFNDYDEFMAEGKLLIDNSDYRNIFIELLNNIASKG